MTGRAARELVLDVALALIDAALAIVDWLLAFLDAPPAPAFNGAATSLR